MSGVGFLSGFDSWDHFKRFGAGVVISAIAIAGASVAILSLGNLTVETPTLKIGIANDNEKTEAVIESITVEEYGTLIKTSDGTQLTNAIVPANKLWLDTKIMVKPGSRISIAASGAVNLATHLSNDIARDPSSVDLRSFNFLIDPSGKALNGRASTPRQADTIRRKLAIFPDAGLGQLLAVVGSGVGRSNVKPVGIQAYNAKNGGITTFTYAPETNEVGTLYLTANDLVASPDPEDREIWLLQRVDDERVAPEAARKNIANAYFAGNISDQVAIEKKTRNIDKRWQTIVENQYWEAFLEDNAGYFQVAIRISPPE